MILGKFTAENFQSYAEIEFDFADLNLALVSGETGTGKSTLMDGPAWTLFGVTSKDTAADDVKAWGAESATRAELEVVVPEGKLVVTRVRGKPAQNDLYWSENGGSPVRGKDLKETQVLLEKRLGLSAEVFLTASYMSQFMDGGKFFTAKAKERREVLDKIADTSIPNRLASAASEARKVSKRELEAKEQEVARAQGKHEQLKSTVERTAQMAKTWEINQVDKIAKLEAAIESWETDRTQKVSELVTQLEKLDAMIQPAEIFAERDQQIRTQLKALSQVREDEKVLRSSASQLQMKLASLKGQRDKLCSLKGDTCPTCLGPTKNPNLLGEVGRLEAELEEPTCKLASVEKDLKVVTEALSGEKKLRDAHDVLARETRENDVFIARFKEVQAKAIALRDSTNSFERSLETERKAVNPYSNQVDSYSDELNNALTQITKLEKEAAKLQHRIASLTWLYDQSFALRGMLLEKAVRSLNKRLNGTLERYFDANLRVKMTLTDSDNLEVEINNAGYPCKFGQLSGGERAQLKLAFSLALLEAAQNASGRKFETIMFDEALNGMDNSLKVKAFGAFQELAKEHSTVLLIDHSEELKQLFDRQFLVTKHGATSEIRESYRTE